MIPLSIVNEYKIIKYPSKTYNFDIKNKRIIGMTDGLEAMRQTIYKILRTERYEYVIYNCNYGIELKDVFGRDVLVACAVLERRIKDALSADDRIIDVYDFDFSTDRNTVTVEFTVSTDLGKLREEVSINV